MSNEYLKHIFDQSACLTAKQLKSYVSGNMVHEEAHAVEVHLLSCPFCADAVDGVRNSKGEDAFNAMEALPKEFMKKHLGESEVDEYLNKPTVTQAHEVAEEEVSKVEKKQRTIYIWRITSIAAAVILGVGAIWLLRGTFLNGSDKTTIAENANIKKVEKPEANYSAPVVTTTDSSTEEMVADEAVSTTQPDDAQTEQSSQEELVAVETKAAEEEKRAQAKTKEAAAKKVEVEKAVKPDKKASADMVARQVSNTDAGSSAAGVDKRPRMGNSYVADEQDPALTAVAREETAAAKEPESKLTGGQLYHQKKYREALKKFQQEMNSTEDRDRRDNARIMIARCYLELGQNSSAKAILESLIEEKSSEKRQAKKLLMRIE